MSVNMTQLVTGLSHASSLLSAEESATLAAAVIAFGDLSARAATIRRRDVTLADARAVAATDPGALSPALLSRGDVPTEEVLAALPGLIPTALRVVAEATRDPQVLTYLARWRDPSADQAVMAAVAKNRSTPRPEAVRALQRAVAAQPAPESVTAFAWLRYDHNVPTAVVEAWAPKATSLRALTEALMERPSVSRAALQALVDLAVPEAGLPDGDTLLCGRRLEALTVVTRRTRADAAFGQRLRDRLDTLHLWANGSPAADHLGLPGGAKVAPKDLTGRAWRNNATRATKNPDAAADLLATMARHVGADPGAWAVLGRIGDAHTGTVGELLDTAAAVARPAGTA